MTQVVIVEVGYPPLLRQGERGDVGALVRLIWGDVGAYSPLIEFPLWVGF